MTIQQISLYIKKSLFWLIYIALMGIFSFLFILLLQELYYIITASAYWRTNLTPHPDHLTPEPPTAWEYADIFLTLLLCALPISYNIWLILKRKNKKFGLIFLIVTIIFLQLYNFIKCNCGAFCG